MDNVYNYFTDIVVTMLMGNISTLQSHNTTLDVYTQTSEQLSYAWTTGPGSDEIQNALNKITNNKEMASFITQYLTSGYIYDFSATLGAQVMEKLSSSGVWDSTNGPSQMNIINQWNSMISSTGQNEETLGQNGVKAETSVLQQDASTQQPLSDVGNSVFSIGANIGSLLQQLYA